MANFSLDNSEIVRAVLMQTGLGRDPTHLDEASEADVRSIVRSGLRRFFFPTQNGFVYQWRFLEKRFPLSAEPVFKDGTIAVSGGTVTLTDGMWPADIVDHFIKVGGHILFVSERTDDTEIAVTHTQLEIDAGTEFEAPRYRYPLPSDFGEFLGGVRYFNGADNRPLFSSDEPQLRLRYAVGWGALYGTTHYAVHKPYISFWPTPEPDAYLEAVYMSIPEDQLPADLTTPGSVVQVEPIYAEAVLEAILAAAEAYNDDRAGIHEHRFQTALQAAIVHDRSVGGAYDFSRQMPSDYRGHGPVSGIDFSQQL